MSGFWYKIIPDDEYLRFFFFFFFSCDFDAITELTQNQQKFPTIQIIRCVNKNSPLNITATAGGITKIPTSQSATAKWWKNQPLINVKLTQYIFWLVTNK